MAAYATAADLINYTDARWLGDMASDDGKRVPATELTDSGKITAALETASGLVESSCLQGKRYSTTDLSGLTGNSLAYLKMIVCDVAAWRLSERRRYIDPKDYESRHTLAMEHLNALRNGSQVFNVADNLTAGVIDGTDGPTTVQLETLNLIRDRTKRFYPVRRTPGNR